jgi:colanic acid biosynthesis glycosyl transferase WcaI
MTMSEGDAEALFVTQYYRPELIGSGPFCGDIAEWLSQNGRRVTVLTGAPHYPLGQVFAGYKGRNMPERESLAGVHIERLRTVLPKRGSAISRILAEVSFLLGGMLALASRRVRRQSLVLSLCPSVLSVAVGNLARRRGGRHIAIMHDIQSGLARGLGMVGSGWLLGLMRVCERAVLNRADLIAVLTEEMRRQLRMIGVTAPIEVIPIWVDTNRILPLDLGRNGPTRVLYSGNLGKKQGLGQVIDLAAELQRKRPEIEIIIRGAGNQAEPILAEIAARDLKNIRVTDLLPQELLSQGLAEGDIHLVPQDPEAAEFAVPSKIFNVMAAGRPFIATARPGSPLWLLQEQSGAFLCSPPHDAGAFVAAVLRLVDDEAYRRQLGDRGRHFVEQNYSKAKVLGEFTTLIDELHATS